MEIFFRSSLFPKANGLMMSFQSSDHFTQLKFLYQSSFRPFGVFNCTIEYQFRPFWDKVLAYDVVSLFLWDVAICTPAASSQLKCLNCEANRNYLKGSI